MSKDTEPPEALITSAMSTDSSEAGYSSPASEHGRKLSHTDSSASTTASDEVEVGTQHQLLRLETLSDEHARVRARAVTQHGVMFALCYNGDTACTPADRASNKVMFTLWGRHAAPCCITERTMRCTRLEVHLVCQALALASVEQSGAVDTTRCELRSMSKHCRAVQYVQSSLRAGWP